MPVFGDASRFAIEYELDQSYGAEWMFGRFCYWCGGRRLGDFDLGTSLRDVLFQLERLAAEPDREPTEYLSSKSGSGAFRALDEGLFGSPDAELNRIAEDEQWARFCILPAVDVFDQWKAFLFEDEDWASIVFGRSPYDELTEVALCSGEAKGVLVAVVSALRRIYEAEMQPERWS